MRWVLLLLFYTSASAADWYVASTVANSTGSGTLNSPGSLSNAIAGSGWAASIAGGDTVWLRGGSNGGYSGRMITNASGFVRPFMPAISGSSSSAMITWRSYTNEWAVIGGQWSFGDTTFHRFRDLEFYDPYKGQNPTNAGENNINGPWSMFANHASFSGNEFINCVIHDCGNCFQGGGPTSVRGCVFWYVGLNGLEHLLYGCTTNFLGNAAFWTASDTVNFPDGLADYAVYRSNILAGLGKAVAIVGGGSDFSLTLATHPTNIDISFNYIFNGLPDTDIGVTVATLNGDSTLPDGANRGFTVNSNVFIGGKRSASFGSSPIGSVSFVGNTLMDNVSFNEATFHRRTNSGSWTADYNTYRSRTGNTVSFIDTNNGPYLTFSQWTNIYPAYDQHSTASNATVPDDAVYVIPNQDQAKRAHIAVYNWSLSNNVSVDPSRVLAVGDTYRIYSVQDYNAGPLRSGTYSGGTISVPMTNLSVASYICAGQWMTTPPALNPEFGAFVLIGSAGTTVVMGNVVVSGNGVIQ